MAKLVSRLHRIVLSERSESKEQQKMSFYVYFLKDLVGNLYIGQTNNLQAREKQQLSKSTKAAKFIKDGNEFKLVYYETYATRKESMNREKQLKGWSRAKKEALIARNFDELKHLSKRRKCDR